MTRRFRLLDRDAVRRLEIGQQIREHGIIVERRANGDIRWSVQIRVDGGRVHRVIGFESDGATRYQAEVFLEQKRTEAREGRLSLPQGRKVALAFEAAADAYLAKLKESGGLNIDKKETQLRLYLKPFFGRQHLTAISTFSVDRYKMARKKAGASNATANRELATLRHLFTCALDWRWISTRPCKIKLLPEEQGQIAVLSDAEAEALLAAAAGDVDEYCHLFVSFGLLSAMRHSEILAARFEHVDFEQCRLHIPRQRPVQGATDHAGATRHAPPRARAWPMTRPDGSSRRHPTRSSPASGTARVWIDPSRAPSRSRARPGEGNASHMRHTAITNLVKSGADLPTIQRISDTGHSPWCCGMRRFTASTLTAQSLSSIANRRPVRARKRTAKWPRTAQTPNEVR